MALSSSSSHHHHHHHDDDGDGADDDGAGDDGDLTVRASDVLRLIQAHLTECGLHGAAAALREESGVKAAGTLHSEWSAWASRGAWDKILTSLGTLDDDDDDDRLQSLQNHQSHRRELVADVYEMAILELAELGDVGLAHALMRSVSGLLDRAAAPTSSSAAAATLSESLPRTRVLDQRLAALQAMRSSKKNGQTAVSLPHDYYGASMSRQERRNDIGRRLMETVPRIPSGRLTTLLQQAVKWQSHTGQLPMIKKHWPTLDEQASRGASKNKKRKVFDLVLGESSVAATLRTAAATATSAQDVREAIPTRKFSSISFGKKATAEVAVFTPDGASLVTGSSDGLIEIWSSTSRYKELRMDLPYQQKEELLGHDDTIITAMTVSNDGAMLATGDATGLVKVWKIDNGNCLRDVPAHPNSTISCLDFSADASHILTASQDGVCREYGLRTQKMMKEFRGHSSFINTCKYMLLDGNAVLRVVTSSADGTARVWDGKSSLLLQVFCPTGPSHVGTSIIQPLDQAMAAAAACPNLHTAIPLHAPPESILLVPRGPRAFVVSIASGVVLQTFDATASNFVAATVSPSNQWLHAVTEKGDLRVYNMSTGDEEAVLTGFAEETCKSSGIEMTSIVHHPHKGILAAFSNSKSQKKGLLGLWK